MMAYRREISDHNRYATVICENVIIYTMLCSRLTETAWCARYDAGDVIGRAEKDLRLSSKL